MSSDPFDYIARCTVGQGGGRARATCDVCGVPFDTTTGRKTCATCLVLGETAEIELLEEDQVHGGE